MSELIDKVKKTIEDSLELAKNNAQNLKEMAGEYGKVARLKIDLHQMASARRKKLELLGETVFPFMVENNIDKLKKHETLQVLIDEIKSLDNEINLAQNALNELTAKEKEPDKAETQQKLHHQILELEDEIETRLNELKVVKEAIDK